MAFSPDVLVTALQDLKSKYTELFLKGHPVLSYILDKGVTRYDMQGPYREFTVVTGGPGSATGLRTGSETLRSQRRNRGVRGNEYCYLYIYHYDVPGKDLDEANGKQDLARLLKAYPELAMGDARQRWSRQFVRGSASSAQDPDGTDADGFVTLNGSQTYNPQGTARTGVFQYSTTQTATVFGLPMANAASNATTGWAHQYAHINSFALEGAKTARTLMTRASQEGKEISSTSTDLVISDEGSYQNAVDYFDERVIVIDNLSYAPAKYIDREGIKFGKADWYWEPDIDITDTTSFSNANAQLGVAYMLNTSFWELMIMRNNPEADATENMFSFGEAVRLPDQYAYQYRIMTYINPYCTSLRHQSLMTGGSQE